MSINAGSSACAVFWFRCCLLLSSLAFAQSGTLGLKAPQLYQKGMNSLIGVGVSRNDLNAVDYFAAPLNWAIPGSGCAGIFL